MLDQVGVDGAVGLCLSRLPAYLADISHFHRRPFLGLLYIIQAWNDYLKKLQHSFLTIFSSHHPLSWQAENWQRKLISDKKTIVMKCVEIKCNLKCSQWTHEEKPRWTFWKRWKINKTKTTTTTKAFPNSVFNNKDFDFCLASFLALYTLFLC